MTPNEERELSDEGLEAVAGGAAYGVPRDCISRLCAFLSLVLTQQRSLLAGKSLLVVNQKWKRPTGF
tara:strand:- start:317 stop:517 length:201 start_codon:yes stop_codon:yes gene_type:complete